MSMKNLLHPISENSDQDDILPMSSDENLSFNISNPIITTQNQDQLEVDQDDNDHITEVEKIPFTLKEVTVGCNQINYTISNKPASEKDPIWKSHLKELLKLNNYLRLSKEANKVHKSLNDIFLPFS
ncbi:hypothetical protein O181_116593 [Austropuccinia psidii MF-1]|uniref:Uncharacterized protein n=1 Tax=Austropuccinia psidii MF-1 TaxID=1389203 RepID=A0A9Q3K8P3_9BASI|nr:hypothetical protein [Austropuccinia psidii MF-1]